MSRAAASPRSGRRRRAIARSPRSFPIVGIGASAGGLEALQRLLKHLPADTGMAFLVVQHLDPTHESHLTNILARATALPVTEATDRMQVSPDHVYIIPPNKSMFIRDTTLRLEPRRDTRDGHMPVDFLFRSLATAHRNKAVGVILSGTASDGAAGMRAIKGEGGITFAQEAGSAKFFGMPHASIATGAVDFVLPPEAIARSLARLGRHPYVTLAAEEEAEARPLPGGHDEPVTQIFQLLKTSFGVDFGAYKHSTIHRRIRRRMALHGLEQAADYLRYLRRKPDELRVLYHDMFIGVTGFFREPEAFEALQKSVFPRILKDRAAEAPIRIWVPGCSTGEEVYSLAITILEYLKDRAGSVPVQVFGTDVNEEAVRKARLGHYLEDIAAEVGRTRLRRFFAKTDEGYQVSQTVRDMCVFAKHNLVRDPPFARLDLLSCRNVLIYLDAEAQGRLLPLFHYTLKPVGFLLLGTAETIGGFSELFTLVDSRQKIYAKKTTLARPRFDWMPAARPFSLPERTAEPAARRSEFDLQKEAADLIILNEYGPAAVLVNEDMEILHFRGHTGPYLEPAPGVASLNLLKMVREGLLVGVRTAIQAARKRNAFGRADGLRLEVEGRQRTVNVQVTPVRTPGSGQRSFLVLFHDVSDRASPAAALKARRGGLEREHEERLLQLKQELTSTKAYLQSVIENQEAANEELRSLNEELLSTNEELQSTTEELETSNEELQSSNEELITLNEELQHRNEELGVAHNDILNLMNSISLSVIIVDRELRIRRLTPTATREMGLLPADVGRPLTDVRLNVDIPDLERLVTGVMEAAAPREVELRGRDGRWRLIMVNPYVTAEGRIEGAVLKFKEIHATKVAADMFRAFVESAPDAMVVVDGTGAIRLVNAQAERLFGYTRDELLSEPLEKLVAVRFQEQYRDHRRTYADQPLRALGSGLDLSAVAKDGREFPVEISLSPIETPDGLFLSSIIRDVSGRRPDQDQAG